MRGSIKIVAVAGNMITAILTNSLAAQDIDVPPAAVGGNFLGQLSPTTRLSVGQTFRAPTTQNSLRSFSFFLQNWNNFSASQYRAYVARFSVTRTPSLSFTG
jgi:hypothetical protein